MLYFKIVQQLFDKSLLSVCNKSFKRRKISDENLNELQIDIRRHSRLKKHFRRKTSRNDKELTHLNIFNMSEKGLRFNNIFIKTEEAIRELKGIN